MNIKIKLYCGVCQSMCFIIVFLISFKLDQEEFCILHSNWQMVKQQ